MKLALTLIAVLAVLPGLWLLRQPSRLATLAASLLLLMIGMSSGYIGVRLWQDEKIQSASPVTFAARPGHFQIIAPDQLPAVLANSQGKPVLLEFYADWCSSCQVWKNTIFNREDVQAALHPAVMLQIDATELTPSVQALLDRYGLSGLPAIVVYDRQGRERPDLRLLGEMSAAEFKDWIKERLLPAT